MSNYFFEDIIPPMVERKGKPCPFCSRELVKKEGDIIFVHCSGKVSSLELVNKVYEKLGSNKIHGEYLLSTKFVGNSKLKD